MTIPPENLTTFAIRQLVGHRLDCDIGLKADEAAYLQVLATLELADAIREYTKSTKGRFQP